MEKLFSVLLFSLLGCGGAGFEAADPIGPVATDSAVVAELGEDTPDTGLTADAGLESDALLAEAAPCTVNSPIRLVINEVRLPNASALIPKEAQFVELLNTGDCPVSLKDFRLLFVLGGEEKGTYYVLHAPSSTIVIAPGERFIAGGASFANGCQTEKLVAPLTDFGELQLAYCPSPAGCGALTTIDRVLWSPYDVGSPEAPLGATKAAPSPEGTMSRWPDGNDTGDPSADFAVTLPSPCAANNPPAT